MTERMMAAPLAKRGISALVCAASLFGGVMLASPVWADAGSVLPFWSRPFPYGYTGPRASCEELRPVETPNGIVYEKVWVCGPVLHSRG